MSTTRAAGRSDGLVRVPLLALALAAFAAFALDSFAVLGHPVPGWDVGLERAVQQVGWGPLAAVFAASDWFEGLKQVAAAIAGILLVALLNRRGFFLMVWGALSAGAYTLIEMFVHLSLIHI